MFSQTLKKSLLSPAVLAFSLGLSSVASATIVEFQTSQGNFQVNLFDQTTPKTVENFLGYVNEQSYTNTVIHRAYPEFIVQGGGFEFSGEWPLAARTANAAIVNEPVYSNVKGTIAMAKRANDPNSATNQWFFNLNDNSANLDLQNSGFTVFGQVIGDGMTIIEKIAQLKLCDEDKELAAGVSDGIPVVISEGQQCSDLATPGMDNFVIVEQITIVDSSEVTDADLTPVKNTLIATPVEPTPTPDSDSGGGSFGWLSVFTLMLLTIRKSSLKKHK